MKEILIALLLLVAGFVLLIKGADFFVDADNTFVVFHVIFQY